MNKIFPSAGRARGCIADAEGDARQAALSNTPPTTLEVAVVFINRGLVDSFPVSFLPSHHLPHNIPR
jgi:hypothetical protein